MPCGPCGRAKAERAAARRAGNATAKEATRQPRDRYTVTDPSGNVQTYTSYVEARRASRAVGGTLRPVDA